VKKKSEKKKIKKREFFPLFSEEKCLNLVGIVEHPHGVIIHLSHGVMMVIMELFALHVFTSIIHFPTVIIKNALKRK
jgi:hypothetical protein